MIETDAAGIFTRFGPAAVAMFGCPAAEAIGKLHYAAFHDADELRACHGSAEFRAALESPGWSEAEWRVIPRIGAPFRARVALARLTDERTGEKSGWIAFYERIDGEEAAEKTNRR